MKSKTKSLIFILLFSIQSVFAQENIKINSNQKITYSSNIKAAYMGSIVYPGFKIGIERPYKEIIKTKRSGKVLDKDRLWSLNAGFYHHATFHTNAFIIAERIRRRTNSKGFFIESSPGIGLSRTFLAGTTYTVDDVGNTSIKKAAGYTYGMVSIAGAIGQDFSVRKNTPFAIYLKPSLLILLPYNSFIYPRPTLELGIIYKPKGFMTANVKRIKKSK